jgi:DNA mismatch repair protein MutS
VDRAALGESGEERPLRASFDAEYDALVAEESAALQALERLAETLRAQSGMTRLKVEQTPTQGWSIEVPANSRVPADWIRKGSLARAERYTCAALEEVAGRLAGAREARLIRERGLLDDVVARLRSVGPALRAIARNLAAADSLQSLATVAEERDWICPTVDESRVLDIQAGRHPVLEQVLGDALVPNSVRLVSGGDGDQVMVLTGPNMAGKSSLQRQVALLTLLAQAGSYLPAREATIGLVDGIYTRLGSADDLAHGQSTFFVEMLETAQILRHATDRSLCLFDELGRGTSTFDGMAIAYAVLEHLATGPVQPRTILATHYHELAGIAEQLARVGAYRMAVREDASGVTFCYRLEPGGADRSYGLAVARMAGLPESVLARAEAVTQALEPVTREGQRALRRALQSLPTR